MKIFGRDLQMITVRVQKNQRRFIQALDFARQLMRINQNIQVNGDFEFVVLLTEVIDEKPRAGINQGQSRLKLLVRFASILFARNFAKNRSTKFFDQSFVLHLRNPPILTCVNINYSIPLNQSGIEISSQ